MCVVVGKGESGALFFFFPALLLLMIPHVHTHKNQSQIRAMAAELDLPTQARKDSQGICFLGKLR